MKVQSKPEPVVRLLRSNRLQIDYMSVDKLWQPDGAPRKFSKKEISKAEQITRRSGIRLPILATPDGRVISGFVVVIVARKLGIDEVPVVYVDDLSAEEQDMLSIGLDRLYELGKFDDQLLGALLIDLELKVPEIDFGDLGLDQAEVDRAMGAVCAPDDVEPAVTPPGPAVTRLGDIWLAGQHRIGCGDAGDPKWLTRVMGGALAAMVFADPPYGCRVAGFVTTRKHREFAQGAGKESETELSALFLRWCEVMKLSCKPGALVYLCIDWRSQHLLQAAAAQVFGKMLNMIVWAKDVPGLGSLYRSQFELILLFRVPGAEHLNNVELGRHGRNRTNLWRYPSAKTFGRSGTEGDLLADHPTPKNKEMIADAILDCTKRGDVVLDPFLGSGSTLIAAEKVGRAFCGSDLDPAYVDLAIRRWQAWTGREAVHGETGKTFREMARERAMEAAQHGEASHEQ